ncbi:MAG: universal stress protein [Dehalococcoidales bacterium]|nr:universal stress protein [Dehalococcoidales bacterium]
MYQKILAPLDGSELAESTLEHLRNFVLVFHIPEVVILRVVEPLPAQTIGTLARVTSSILTNMENENKNAAQRYIQNVAKQLETDGINATPVVLEGNPAEEILKYAKNNNIDLIIMSTHGRSGIKRWLMGSVANRILEHSSIPVMTIVPKGIRS